MSKNFPFTRGVPRQKKIFPVWTCIKPNLVSKNFPFTRGGSINKKIFFPVWTCIKPNLVSKNFPFTRGGSLHKKFFFPVWTCIKPNLVSKNFPFSRGGSVDKKNFFSSLNMYQAKSGVKKFFPFTETGTPPPPLPPSKVGWAYPKIWDLGPSLSKAGSAYPKIWDLGPPPIQGWISLSKNLRPGTPPQMLADRHPWKQYLPVVLRTRAVTTNLNFPSCS